MKHKSIYFMMLLFVSLLTSFANTNVATVSSPDGKMKADFYLSETKSLQWKLDYEGKPVVLLSRLGITGFIDGFNIKKVSHLSKDTVWKPLYGEKDQIRDHYQECTIELNYPKRKQEMWLQIRAYDEGLAFRYFFPESPNGGTYLSLKEELTSFTFPEKTLAWFTPRAQAKYSLLPLRDWPDECERPLTLQLENGLYACLGEAEMVNYARTKFSIDDKKANTIVCSQYDVVDEISAFATPWRLVMVAEKPGALLENNFLYLNLNPPCAIDNPWWIRPGKVMREPTLSTEGGKRLVDFAVKRNLQYIHFDAGWYGYEYAKASDAAIVNVDPRRNPKNDLNLPEVIAYAKKNNIGVILYVNQRALANQLDEILPLYQSWGVDGVKFGFVQVGSHRWTTWLHEAIKKCAEHHLVVDIHDEYRPTGFSRTYPNLMTQEGIFGNEEMPDATNNTILPFTRFIAGAADYTICYYKQKSIIEEKYAQSHTGGIPNERHIQTTSAHQLALAAIYYSPLQYMYWYDKPEDSRDEPELAFFDAVPTVWNDTKVIDGTPGQYAVVARRSGQDWFLGGITNNDGREISIPLSFLSKDRSYIAHIYTDDEKVKTQTHVRVESKKVKAGENLVFQLKPSGGVAIHFEKVN